MMRRVRNTHPDSEATVIKANRKHQIVLNMEVKRIEMEKKMRERYFSFEMSLVRAHRLKIIERQKSLGVYRPRTMENAKEFRKGMQTTSFFFTHSVAMDSKVKLPPVLRRSRTDPVLQTKPEGNSKLFNISQNFANRLIIGKEQAKRRQSRKEGTFDGYNGLSQQNGKPPNTGGRMREAAENQRKTDNVKDNLKSNDVFGHKDGMKKQSVDRQNLLDKDDRQLQDARKDNGVERKAHESEQNIPHPKRDSPAQNQSKEAGVQETPTEEVNSQNAVKKLPLSEKTDKTFAKAQNVSNFTKFKELRARRSSIHTSYFADDFDKCLLRSKSAKGYRMNIEVGSVVRPQTALAKLTIQ